MSSSSIANIVIYSLFISQLIESLPTRNGDYKSLWTRPATCPPGFFINGISLVFSNSTLTIPMPNESPKTSKFRRSVETFTPVLGLIASCSCVFPSEPDFHFEYSPFRSESPVVLEELPDNFAGDTNKCEFPSASVADGQRIYGMVAGIQSSFISQKLTGLNVFCNNEEGASLIEPVDPNLLNRAQQWNKPNFCPWGHYACGVKLRYDAQNNYILDVKTECCRLFSPNPGWKTYRGETAGRVLSTYFNSTANETHQIRSHELDLHYASQLDDPIYFAWDFCPVGSYVTGLQGQPETRQFRLSCSDISQPAPRLKSFLDSTPLRKSLNATINNAILSQWEDEDELTPHVECEGGVVIGFQALYSVSLKEIWGLRLFCSHSKDNNDMNKLEYIKVLLPFYKDPKETNSNKPRQTKQDEKLHLWGQAEMCKRGEAVCGWKSQEITDPVGNLKGTEHLKVKCCLVPSMAEICAPFDDYELVMECDARQALADTTCMYTLTEGFTATTRITEEYASTSNLRNTLSTEWGLTESDTLRISDERGSSSTDTNSTGSSGTSSRNFGIQVSSSDTASQANSNSSVATNGISKGNTTSAIKGITANKATDTSTSNTLSSSIANLAGFSSSNSHTRSSGASENFLRTMTAGGSLADSKADTVGSSSGFVSAHTTNEGKSGSTGYTEGNSESTSSTNGGARTAEISGSLTAGITTRAEVEAKVDVPLIASATVKGSFEASYSATVGARTDVSENYSGTKSKDKSTSRNTQYTSDHSKSNMNQETKDRQNSNTNTVHKENNFGNSSALGGETNAQKSDASTNEQNMQNTLTSGNDTTKSETVRQDRGISVQNTSQVNTEENASNQTSRGSEKSFSRQVGTQREDSVSASLTRNKDSSASLGKSFSNSETREGSRTKSGNKGDSRERAFTTGYDWSKSSEKTWRSEKTFQVSMLVPQGMRTRLFQVVGYCAHFQARTNNFRRIDDLETTKNGVSTDSGVPVIENGTEDDVYRPAAEENIGEQES